MKLAQLQAGLQEGGNQLCSLSSRRPDSFSKKKKMMRIDRIDRKAIKKELDHRIAVSEIDLDVKDAEVSACKI